MQQIRTLFSQYRGLRREIYILFFGRVVTNLGSMVWPLLTMIMSQKMGLSASAISVVSVVAMLLMLPANLIGGRLADRFNKKRIIVCFDAVSVVSYLICAFLPLSGVTVALMLTAGICQSVENPAYNALIADLSMTKDRDRAFSLHYLGANLGLVLSPTIGGFLFKDHLWLCFLISGISIGLSTVLIGLCIRNIAPEKDESEKAAYQMGRDGESLWKILRSNRVMVLFLLTSALYYAAYHQYSFLMPLEMGRIHGAQGAVLYGTVSSMNCIVVVLFTPLITRLFRRMADPAKMLWGEGLVAVGYLCFLLLLGHIPAYYLAMLLFTWGEIAFTIADGPYLSSRVPASHRGRVTGFSAVLGAVIQSVSQFSVGRMYDTKGSAPTWILVLCLVAAAGVLTVILRLRDKKAYPKLYE